MNTATISIREAREISRREVSAARRAHARGEAGPDGLNSKMEIKRGNLTYTYDMTFGDIFGPLDLIEISRNGIYLGVMDYDEETWSKIVNGADPVADGWITKWGGSYSFYEDRYYDADWRAMLLRGAME